MCGGGNRKAEAFWRRSTTKKHLLFIHTSKVVFFGLHEIYTVHTHRLNRSKTILPSSSSSSLLLVFFSFAVLNVCWCGSSQDISFRCGYCFWYRSFSFVLVLRGLYDATLQDEAIKLRTDFQKSSIKIQSIKFV